MNKTEFVTYKKTMRDAIRSVLKDAEEGRLDEAAFPAYSHPNPLINWLFWQRVRIVMNYLERRAPYERVLDFGCGSGVLLPFLSTIAHQVIAADIDMMPLTLMREKIEIPSNVKAFDLKEGLGTLPAASFDIVTALDVLEHVDDLPGTLDALLNLLKPTGALVISGPTENLFYKIGRSVAGEEYSGHYHERGIKEIRTALASRVPIESIATLYPPVVLFEVFAGKKA